MSFISLASSQPKLASLMRAFATMAPVQFSKLTVERTKSPRPRTPDAKLVFGRAFTDHMLMCDWNNQKGWDAPKIVPFQNLSLSPAVSSLHYGVQCFEGMKAYVDAEGKVRLFRPMMNMNRMNVSCKRLCLPGFDPAEMLKCLRQLVLTDKDWIPRKDGYSLYIRPTMIGTHPALGVAASSSAKFYTILSPVGPYYPTGFNPVKLYCDNHFVRAWPGGTGYIKCGGNYAAGLYPQAECQRKGYSQIMWLFGSEEYVTEVGTMNQFFLWKTPDGETELVTAPLDGTILPGVTRDSILSICRSWGEFKVSERKYTIYDVIEALESGRLLESFGAGTAAVVTPVKGFFHKGKDYNIPLPKGKKAGPLTQRLYDTITGIQVGKIEHEFSEVIGEL